MKTWTDDDRFCFVVGMIVGAIFTGCITTSFVAIPLLLYLNHIAIPTTSIRNWGLVALVAEVIAWFLVMQFHPAIIDGKPVMGARGMRAGVIVSFILMNALLWGIGYYFQIQFSP